ncbi:hypothetical protein N9D31_03095, partial [Oligoflexaceae bacterium]|nr:hypothetical protein [Oligoflexaceae bacterium]
KVGDHNLVMAYSHIAHDCVVGNHVIIANGVQIAGHSVLGDHSVYGGMAGIHQFSRVGKYAMVGAGAIVVKDVPPFCMVQGDRARPIGLNVVGLRRSSYTKEDISVIKAIYKSVYQQNSTLEDAISFIKNEMQESPVRQDFLEFLEASKRGIVR